MDAKGSAPRRKGHRGQVFFDRMLMRRLREGRGWTFRELHAATGVSNPYLCQIEGGSVQNLSLEAAVAIADAFGLAVTTFILRAPLNPPESR